MAMPNCLDRAVRAALAAPLLALAVSPPPVAAQPSDELRQQLGAFDLLAAELGPPAARSGPVPSQNGDGGGVPPQVLWLRDAFCRVLYGSRPVDDPAPCAMEGDWTDLLDRQAALQRVFDLANSAYSEARGALADHVFETTVCPAGRDVCDEPEALREWWREWGPRAFDLLDRIGRERRSSPSSPSRADRYAALSGTETCGPSTLRANPDRH